LTRSRFLASLFILGFLSLQIFLIARCYFTPQKYFGWQMFSDPVLYRVEFYGVDGSGQKKLLSREDYRPWFRGKFPHVYSLPAGRYRTFHRGKEFLIEKFSHYPKFLCGKLKDKGYREIELTVEYREAMEKQMSRKVFQARCVNAESA